MCQEKINGKILVVGGTWDENGGKPSGLVRKFAEFLQAGTVCNGGIFGIYRKSSNLL